MFLKLISIILISLISCHQIGSYNTINCNEESYKTKKSTRYKTDSSFINFTVYTWIDSSYSWYAHYVCDTSSEECKNIVHIGDIFYSPDSLKLTAFVYIQYHKNTFEADTFVTKSSRDTFFDSHTIMGYRGAIDQDWKLFALNEVFIGQKGHSLVAAENYHKSIFLDREEMRKRKISEFDPLTGQNTKYSAINFLPCEDSFWTHSPLWRRGNRVPGYYVFETFMNSTPNNRLIRPSVDVNYLHK